MQRILFNFYLALEGVFANKLRAILTALGIVFGVGAVIAMLAIGTGAREAILEQMKLIGTNSIVISSMLSDDNEDDDSSEETQQGKEKKQPYSPGLTLDDVKALQKVVPTADAFSPEIVFTARVIQSAKLIKTKCVGVTNDFFELNGIKLGDGNNFHHAQMEGGKPVCIIGKRIQNKFFSEKNPIGQKIKCNNTWLTIIGVLEQKVFNEESRQNLGIRDYNSDIYIPISTALLRFENRAFVSKRDIGRRRNNQNSKAHNYHQLDRIVIRVDEPENLTATADLIARILKRRHNGVLDFQIDIPEKAIEAQQETQDTFNSVLAFIAGISLLVGGIGIMNIMLASVLERIKEIGVRRSLGANRQDILLQFLFEAIFISLIGGLIGIIVGVTVAKVISESYGIPTIISTWSILLSFGVASIIGLIFGIVPARNAANHDPIKALRTD